MQQSTLSTRDYYEVLGVARDADGQTIKAAFHRLARRYHPDQSAEPDAEERFKDIAEAYAVLSDPAKRAEYDTNGSTIPPGFTTEDLIGTMDLGDLLDAGLDLGALFGRLFNGRNRGGGAMPLRGSDVHTEIHVTLMEVVNGTEATFRLNRGSAQVAQTITVKIPPGIEEGATLRVRGRGQPSSVLNGPAGDLHITVHIVPHPDFERRGADLWRRQTIPVTDAVLGTTLTVKGLHGTVPARIPPGTQPGTVLRIDGEGLPYFRRRGRGDLYLTIDVAVPSSLTPGQRQLYEQLREAPPAAKRRRFWRRHSQQVAD
jgi:curved DNA-binding protein